MLSQDYQPQQGRHEPQVELRAEKSESQHSGATLETIGSIDLTRYQGDWYEIARLPNRFEEVCVCGVKAHYKLLESGEIEVANQCFKQASKKQDKDRGVQGSNLQDGGVQENATVPLKAPSKESQKTKGQFKGGQPKVVLKEQVFEENTVKAKVHQKNKSHANICQKSSQESLALKKKGSELGPQGVLQLSVAKGIAWQPKAGVPGQLKVSFVPFLKHWHLFGGDYWILELDPDYRYALVGSPDYNYLWILSRTPCLDQKIQEKLVQQAKILGFAVEKLVYPSLCA